MTFEINISQGWTEAIIDNDCEFSKFTKIASIFRDNLNITFTEHLNDFDSFYFDFNYFNSNLCLHYNVYLGVSIFPKSFKNASQSDNDNVVKIATTLMTLLQDFNWKPFDNLKSIGTTGSEGGQIIDDIENIDGARITLEKNCGNIPFAVTLGIYGLMFHTHFDSEFESANSFIKNSKLKINKVFEMHNLPEKERTELWHSKHNRLMEELAEMTND
jgi:hypothetical protein